METYILDKKDIQQCQKGLIKDPLHLLKLVKEMEVAVSKGPVIDYNSIQRFTYDQKGKLNPFGYEKLRTTENFRNHYRRNSLCQKLIRIRNEFKFVKQHMVYYKDLTQREKEIMQLLATGHNNPRISEKLFISRRTVEQHRKHINLKLHLTSLPHLIKYAYAFDLI